MCLAGDLVANDPPAGSPFPIGDGLSGWGILLYPPEVSCSRER